MVALSPDRTFSFSGGAGAAVGAGTQHEALNPDRASYSVVAHPGGQIAVGFPTPSGLTSDAYRWVRGYLTVESRWNATPSGWNMSSRGGYVDVTYPVQPQLLARVHTTNHPTPSPPPGPWSTVRTAVPGYWHQIQGPRSMFTAGQWVLNVVSETDINWIEVNALKFEIVDYLDPPTATIIGPTGTVTIVGGAYVPVQWTPSLPYPTAPYSGWWLEVARNSDGTGVIYKASGTTETTHQIPAYALTGYLGTQLYIRVAVGHRTWDDFLGPDPYTGLNQFGPFAQAAFTPTGAITSTYQAQRPSSWVDDLSAANRALLTRSHQPTFDAVLYSWDGAKSWPLEIIDGDVTFDASQQVRRTFSLTVANPELRARAVYPMDPDRPLHPFGSYVQLARGVGDQLVAICCGMIEAVTADLTVSGEGPVIISGSDWSRWFADARLGGTTVRQSWNGAAWVRDKVTDVLKALVNEAGLTWTMSGSSSASVAPNYATERTASRPDIADALCAELGWWWMGDTYGRIMFEPLPSQTTMPRYRFVEGADCVVLRHTANLTRDGMHDMTIAYDNAGLYVGGAFDANKSSPIARGAAIPATPAVGRGPFAPGGKPFFFAGPLVTSIADAQATARTILARRAVPAETISIEIIPHPDLRAGHVIEVERVDEAPRPWVVSGGTIPLSNVRPMIVNGYWPVTYVNPSN